MTYPAYRPGMRRTAAVLALAVPAVLALVASPAPAATSSPPAFKTQFLVGSSGSSEPRVTVAPGLGAGTLVVPDQIIDYTWGRPSTFFEGAEQPVTHIDFTHPYSEELRQEFLGIYVPRIRELGLTMILEGGLDWKPMSWTPALIIDTGSFDHNLATMASAHPGAALRPHVKTAKSIEIGRRAVDADHGLDAPRAVEHEGEPVDGLLVAPEQLDHRVDRRRLRKARQRQPERHHHLGHLHLALRDRLLELRTHARRGPGGHGPGRGGDRSRRFDHDELSPTRYRGRERTPPAGPARPPHRPASDRCRSAWRR